MKFLLLTFIFIYSIAAIGFGQTVISGKYTVNLTPYFGHYYIPTKIFKTCDNKSFNGVNKSDISECKIPCDSSPSKETPTINKPLPIKTPIIDSVNTRPPNLETLPKPSFTPSSKVPPNY